MASLDPPSTGWDKVPLVKFISSRRRSVLHGTKQSSPQSSSENRHCGVEVFQSLGSALHRPAIDTASLRLTSKIADSSNFTCSQVHKGASQRIVREPLAEAFWWRSLAKSPFPVFSREPVAPWTPEHPAWVVPRRHQARPPELRPWNFVAVTTGDGTVVRKWSLAAREPQK